MLALTLLAGCGDRRAASPAVDGSVDQVRDWCSGPTPKVQAGGEAWRITDSRTAVCVHVAAQLGCQNAIRSRLTEYDEESYRAVELWLCVAADPGAPVGAGRLAALSDPGQARVITMGGDRRTGSAATTLVGPIDGWVRLDAAVDGARLSFCYTCAGFKVHARSLPVVSEP